MQCAGCPCTSYFLIPIQRVFGARSSFFDGKRLIVRLIQRRQSRLAGNPSLAQERRADFRILAEPLAIHTVRHRQPASRMSCTVRITSRRILQHADVFRYAHRASPQHRFVFHFFHIQFIANQVFRSLCSCFRERSPIEAVGELYLLFFAHRKTALMYSRTCSICR